ncbi:MAG: hypothetical protein JO019_01305, partial [Candidatus Kaiserbacteria bacterium]|nr:hypothetical protein [Candidatus Kaiserbacteria bacterium]
MASQPNILSMFPKLRRIGRMPTAAERVAYWESSRLQRIYAAVNACEWAYSHRQEAFHTDGLPRHPLHPANMARYGCSALGCRLGLTEEDRFVITTGANFKLRSGDGDLIQFHPKFNFKLCSEPESVINAISYPVKCWKVHGITLYSNNMQKEDVSGIFCRIQQPCAD